MSLVVHNLSKKYGDKTALENLSFEMQKPGVFALLGTNGAGKTTAIRHDARYAHRRIAAKCFGMARRWILLLAM